MVRFLCVTIVNTVLDIQTDKMKIIESFGGIYSLSEMDIDELKSLKNIIRSSCLVDKRNFTGVEKQIDQIIK